MEHNFNCGVKLPPRRGTAALTGRFAA